MTLREPRNIHTAGNNCWDTLHKGHGTKTIPVFLLAQGEGILVSTSKLVSLLSGSTVETENIYSCILKVTGQVWESQRRININTNHSYHQLSSPWASLNWCNNKIRVSFNQPNRKRWGCVAGRCNKTSTL